MYRLLFLFLFFLLIASGVHASSDIETRYEAERDRLLSLPYDDRLSALQASDVFDTTSVLGKYFYDSVYFNAARGDSGYALSDSELATLKSSYPRMFLEHEIMQVWSSLAPLDEIESELRIFADIAQENDWPRIRRLATSFLVSTMIEQGHYYSAIMVMEEVSQMAVRQDHYQTVFDYPLIVLYWDMADAYYWSGNYHQAEVYCLKFQSIVPDDDYNRMQGELCKARNQYKLANYQSMLQVSSAVLDEALKTGHLTLALSAQKFISAGHLELGNIQLAKEFAENSLRFANQNELAYPEDLFDIHNLLARTATANGNLDAALTHLSVMEKNNRHAKGSQFDRKLNEVRAEVASLQGDHQLAASLYKTMLKEEQDPKAAVVAWQDFETIADKLSAQEASLLKVKSQLDRAQSRNMTTVALFTTTLSIVGFIAFWRILRQKQKIENFSRLDHLTSVSNRWHALDIIRRRLSTMDRRSDVSCVALIDVDHFKQINDQFGHDAGDSMLIHIAKLFKYQIRRQDVFGRYGGEEFVMLLDNTELSHAEQKVEELRAILAAHRVDGMESVLPLRFSCGLVEVSANADIADVISQCDSLLYKAKHNGRNRTESAIYTPAQQQQRA
ncbi:GGDEF domain-containing protein [Alteromonas sp. H39]|uniref:GGDEF domain-containing protein n=1 Tax=Alteromonas sp. H39 TaxID=3389876 RepID=UPI0039E148A5